MATLKTIGVAAGLIILGPVAGAAVGLGVGYLVASAGRFGLHDGALLGALFLLGGAGSGLVIGIAATYRFVTRPQSK